MAQSQPKPPLKRQSSFETTSDKAAAAFVRRVLVSPHLSTTNTSHSAETQGLDAPAIDASLPPFTSVNEIDLQLYAFIAILVKDCIYSWYAKFSGSPDFVDDVLQVVAHCTRALEERLRRVNLEQLLLDELPAIVETHVQTFRQSRQLATAHNAPADMPVFYSTFRPHPALLPVPKTNAAIAEQACNDSLYRQLLTDGMLALLLPTDDLRNPCLRSLLGEVLGDMILGGFLAGKLCDSIFINGMITRVASSSSSKRKPWAVDSRQRPAGRMGRLTRLGLLTSPEMATKEPARSKYAVDELISSILQYCMLFFSIIQICFTKFTSADTQPLRGLTTGYATLNVQTDTVSWHAMDSTTKPPTSITSTRPSQRPIIAYRLWSSALGLLNIQTRMPWLTGTFALLQYVLLNGPGQLGSVSSRLNTILAHYLLEPIFPLSKHLPTVLSTLRTSAFPDNTLSPGTPSADPVLSVSATKLQSRRAAAFAILNLIPPPLASLYFASHDPVQPTNAGSMESSEDSEVEQMVKAIEADILAPFEHEYLTRHLVYSVLDCVVAQVFPELCTTGIAATLAGKEIVPCQ